MVLFLGRDEPRKGFPVFAEVARSGVDAEFVAVGPTTPTPGVSVLGAVSDAERARLLSAATVLVAPNLAGESFGLVLVFNVTDYMLLTYMHKGRPERPTQNEGAAYKLITGRQLG